MKNKLLFTLICILPALTSFAANTYPKIFFDGSSVLLDPGKPTDHTSQSQEVTITWDDSQKKGNLIIESLGKKDTINLSDANAKKSISIKKTSESQTTVKFIYSSDITKPDASEQIGSVIITWPGAKEVEGDTVDPNNSGNAISLAVQLQAYYDSKLKSNLTKTSLGYKWKDGDPFTIHIFFDQFGNSLYGSIPSGVARKYHYKVHIIHHKTLADGSDFIYSVNKTAGDLSDAPFYYNGNGAKELAGKYWNQSGATEEVPLVDSPFNLFPSSSDLAFEIVLTVIKDSKAKTQKLNSYTIKMTPYYTGAFSIGIMYTWLGNPSFELINSPTVPNEQTVKVTGGGPGAFVTVMYTPYWSPFISLTNAFKKDAKRRAFGRSYLDDDRFLFDKIYPCVGLSLNKNNMLTNWFAGLNWEPTQGIGLYVSQNIRYVNTFDMPDFTPGQTVVSQDQFNYYENKKWKSGWCVGVEVDISAFARLIGNNSAD